MNYKGIKLLGLGLTFAASSAYAQPSVRTNAYYSLKSFNEDMQSKKTEDATKSINEAKEYIDKCYNYSDAKFTGSKDGKTLFYRGKIYMSLAGAEAMKGESADQKMAEEYGKIAIESFKAHIALPKKKSKDDKTDEIKQLMIMGRQEAITAGIELHNKGNYEEALPMYASAIEAYDVIGAVDTIAAFNGGNCALNAEKYDVAEKMFKICAEAGYDGGNSYSKWASALFKQDKEAEALAALEAGKKKYPKDINLHIAEANHYLGKDENDKAQAALDKAVESDPKNPAIHYNIGRIHDLAGRYDEATKSYESALAIDANYFDALYGKGAMLFNRGAASYKKMNDIADNALYAKEKEKGLNFFREALPSLEKCHEINPKDKPTLQALVQIYGKLGMTEKFQKANDLLRN